MKRLIAFALLALGFAFSALADIPKTINYQGRLLDAANQPVVDGQHTVMFRLYTSENELNSIWNEERDLTTQDGYFQVALGEINNLNLANFCQPLWLGVAVKGEIEMSPRQKLGVAPYAISAAQLAAPNSNTQAAVVVDGQGRVGIGTANPLAQLTVNGSIIGKVTMTTGLGPGDDTNEGQITSRVLNFKKLYTDTAIRILYCDNLRVNGNDVAARWEIRIDGSTPPGGAIVQDKYGSSGNYHEPATILGYATGVSDGDHEIQIWVGPVPGRSAGEAATGWSNSRWTIEAQEVWIQ